MPMTRNVADTALMLQAMGGEDASDPWSIDTAVPDYVSAAQARGDLRGKRILFLLPAAEGRPIAAEVPAAFEASLVHLRALGAELIEMPDAGISTSSPVAHHQPHRLARPVQRDGTAAS